MPLSDVDLLCAVQTAHPPKHLCDEFVARFGGFLTHAAGIQCGVWRLRPAEINDVVDEAVAMIVNADVARFDPAGQCLPYLHGLIRNAAKSHARFVYTGAELRHDWSDPDNVDNGLPSRIEDIDDGVDHDVAELVADVIDMADAQESVLVSRHFFYAETLEEIADSLGVDRSTVSRRLGRFYRRVRAYLRTSV